MIGQSKSVSGLYLVTCMADTFTQHVLEFFDIHIPEEGDEWEGDLAIEARVLGETARAAIKRHKEGDEE